MLRTPMVDATLLLETAPSPLLEELRSLRVALAEREQEQSCLQALLEASQRPDEPLSEQFQRMIHLVPLGFVGGEPVAARMVIQDERFSTHGFDETLELHVTRIVAGGQVIGALEVHPIGISAADAPYLLQKRRFLEMVAARFGELIERGLWADEQRRAAELQFSEVHQAIEAEKIEIITRLRSAVEQLSTPITEVWDGVLLLCIVGIVDSRRAAEIAEKLLNAVVQREPYFVLLDITGVEVVDTSTVDFFMKILRCVHLLGVRCILTGIQPQVAQTMIDLDINIETDTDALRVRRTIRSGLQTCILLMECG